MAVFSVNNFSLRIAQRLLLQHLNLEIESPFVLAIIGHNGAGKTTFLKSLTGQAPYEGFFCLNNTPFYSPEGLSNQNIAYLEQKNVLNFDIPVQEMVVMGSYKHKSFLQTYTPSDYQTVSGALKMVGLEAHLNKSILSLSGGESRLAFLAQLLVQNADTYILDEPTNSLDIRNKTRVMNVIHQLHEMGKNIIFTTHDIDYLTTLNGYLINFSATPPRIENINAETIARHKALLAK